MVAEEGWEVLAGVMAGVEVMAAPEGVRVARVVRVGWAGVKAATVG